MKTNLVSLPEMIHALRSNGHLPVVQEQPSPTSPRAPEAEQNQPAPMGDAFVPARADSPSSLYSAHTAPRPASPTSIYSSNADNRSSVDTVRPLNLKSPQRNEEEVATPARRASLDIVGEFLNDATDVRVARDVILQYTQPQVSEHVGDPGTQVAIAAGRFATLRKNIVATDPNKRLLLSEAFNDAYQSVFESIGKGARGSAFVTDLSSSGASTPTSRPSSRTSTRVSTMISSSRLVRSLSTMSLRGVAQRSGISRTQPSTPNASSLDLGEQMRPSVPRSASSLSFYKR